MNKTQLSLCISKAIEDNIKNNVENRRNWLRINKPILCMNLFIKDWLK